MIRLIDLTKVYNKTIAEADFNFNSKQLDDAKLSLDVGAGSYSAVLNFQVQMNNASTDILLAERDYALSLIVNVHRPSPGVSPGGSPLSGELSPVEPHPPLEGFHHGRVLETQLDHVHQRFQNESLMEIYLVPLLSRGRLTVGPGSVLVLLCKREVDTFSGKIKIPVITRPPMDIHQGCRSKHIGIVNDVAVVGGVAEADTVPVLEPVEVVENELPYPLQGLKVVPEEVTFLHERKGPLHETCYDDGGFSLPDKLVQVLPGKIIPP